MKKHKLHKLFLGGQDLENKGHTEDVAIMAMEKNFIQAKLSGGIPRPSEVDQIFDKHDQLTFLGFDYREWKERKPN